MRVSNISALALVTFTMHVVMPTAVTALGVCTISALDTVAGLGTQVSVSGCTPSSQVSLTIKGPSGTSYPQTVATDSEGKASTLIPSKTTVIAGSYSVSAGTQTATFNVIADRADDAHSAISASPKSVASGGQGVVTVSAVLRDRYDNPVSGRPLALISSRASDDVSPEMHQTDDNGQFLWTVRPVEPGTMSLLPYDIISGKQMTMRAQVTVGSTSFLSASLTGKESGGEDTLVAAATDTGNVDHFEIELPQNVTEVKANELFSMTIRAMRGQDNVRSYIGSLVVESSDTDAELPKKGSDPKDPLKGRVDLLNVHQGTVLVPLATMLRTRGPQTISVYDKLDPSITGEITLTVIRSDGAEEKIVILDPKDRARIKGGDSVMIQGKAPSLINLRVKGGKEVVNGESDSEGVFRINVPRNTQDNEMTLFVESENGTYESAPVHIIFDTEAAKIQSLSIEPKEAKTEESATITVRSEPALKSVIATIDGKDITLTESEESGTYIGQTTAPAKEGTYDVSVIVKDSVDNESTAFLQWTVKPKTVPIVEGVSAEAQAGQVLLRWKAVENIPVAEYKVYIATEQEPTNYLYSIGTQKPVVSAIIKDLPLGKKYLFSLTAVNIDKEESIQKSTPVAASPLGFTLRTTPGKDSVLLEWNAMTNLPLSAYRLEYGATTGGYTEKRTVNGQATSMMVRDLIPGIAYSFKLTPITVTGVVMEELTAFAEIILGGTGFTVGASDPVPTDVFQDLHSGADLTPHLQDVPRTTTSGVSTMVAGLLFIGSILFGMSWLRFRRERRMVQSFLQSMQEKFES